MIEILLVVLGSLAGILTAFAVEVKPKAMIEKPTNSNFVYEMIKKIDEYQRLGVITEEEKEELLSAHMDKIPSDHIIVQKVDLTPIKKELMILLDQRISEINTKIDSLKESKPSLKIKQEKSTKPVTPLQNIMPSKYDADDERRELEEIKKRISDTLAKLESTEVE